MNMLNAVRLWILMLVATGLLSACGSAPQAPAPVPVPPTVATVNTAFGAVTGLPNGMAKTTVTVTALDANGNPVANQPVSVQITGNQLVVGAVTTQTVTGTTNAQGIFTRTLTYLAADGVTVTATAGGVAAPAVPAPNPTVTNILFTVPVASGLPADGTYSYTINAQLKDLAGNPVAGETAVFSAKSRNNGIVALSASSAVSLAASGMVSVTVADTNVLNDTVDIYATVGVGKAAFTRYTTVTFVGSGSGSITALNGNTVKLALSPVTGVPADGATVVTATVKALDVYGNPNAGIPITLSQSGRALITPAATVVSDAVGQAVFNITDTYAEAITLTAQDNYGAASAQSLTFTPYASVLTVRPSKTTMLSDGRDVVTLNITASGPQGVVPNEQIQLSSTSATTVLSSPLVITGANGKATATLTETTSGHFQITARTRNGGLLPGQVVTTVKDVYAATPAPQIILPPPAAPFAADGYTTAHYVSVTLHNRASGQALINEPVTFSFSTTTTGGAGQAMNAPGAPNPVLWTNNAGVIDLYVSDTVAEMVTLTATAADQVTTATVPLQFVSTKGTKINLVATTATTAPPNGTTPVTVQATVLDNQLTVPNAEVLFSVSDPYVVLSASKVLTSATGQASVNLTSFNTVTAADVYATLANGVSAAAPVRVAFVQPVGSVLLRASKTTAKADNADVITLTARILDASGQPLAGRSVAFSQQSFANLSMPAVTDRYGETMITVRDGTAETVTVTATAEGVPSTPVVLTFQPLVGGVSLVVTPATGNIPANGTSQATLTATVVSNGGGLPVAGQVVSFADVYGSQAVLSATSAVTNAAGQAVVTLTDAIVEDVYVQATADVYSSNIGLLHFVPSSYLVFPTVNDPFLNTASAAAVPNNPVTLTVTDRSRIAAPNVPFSFAVSSPTAQISPVSGTTDGYGQITINVSDTYAENMTITATNLTTNTVSTIPVRFVNKDAYSLTMSGTPLSVLPDGVSTATLSAVVKTSGGAVAPNAWVQFGMNDPYAVLSATSALTNASGVATVTVRSQQATQVTVTASLPKNNAASAPQPVTVSFEVPVASVSLSSDKASVVADGTATARLSLLVLDAAGNRLGNRTISLSAVGSRSGQPTLTPATVTSSSAGPVSVLLSDAYAEVVTINATANGVAATPLTVNFTPVVGTTNVSVLPSSGIVAADGKALATLVVNVKDTNGSPISGQTLFFSDPYGSQVQLSAATAVTDASGTAQVMLKDAYAETVTIGVGYSAGVGAIVKAKSLSFSPATLQYVVAAKGPFHAGNSYPVTVTVSDAQGRAVKGQVLNVSATPATLVPTPVQLTTDAQGTATVMVTDGVAEAATLSFTDAATAQAFSYPMQFYARDVYSMSMTATPASGVAADGVATATLNVQVRDQYGAAVPNALVDFYTSPLDAYASLSARRVMTGVNGVASVTVARTQAGSVTVAAYVYSVSRAATSSATASVSFGQTPSFITMIASPVRVPADGLTPSTVTVTVKDSVGVPIQGQKVTMSSDGYATLSSSTLVTDALGQGTFTLSDQYAETVTATAVAGSASNTTSVAFTPAVNRIDPYSVVFTNALDGNGQSVGGVTVDVYTTPVSADRYSTYASGLDTVQVSFLLRDNAGNPLSGQAVTLSGSGGQGGVPVVTPTTATTAADGRVTLTVTDVYAELVTLTAAAGGKTGIQKISFSPLPPSSIVASATVPAPAVVGIRGAGTRESSALTFQVVDTNGNLVQGSHLVDFSILNGGLGGGETLTITQASTVNGTVTTNFNSGTLAGAVQVRASLNSNPAIFADVTVTVTGGLPAGSAFGLSTTPLNIEGRMTAGVTQAVTAYVSDFFSNPVAPGIQAQFQTDFGNITGASTFVAATGNSSSAPATITSAFPLPADGFVTAVGQTIGGQHSKVLSLAVDPYNSAVMYAGTDGGGIFKTIDGGANWSHVGIPLRSVGPNKYRNLLGSIVRDLKIDPNNTAVLYAATEKGVFLSRNSGQDWETLTGFARVAGDQLGTLSATTGVFLSDGRWSDDGINPRYFPLSFNATGVRSRMRVYLNGVDTTDPKLSGISYVLSGNGIYLTGSKGTTTLAGQVLTVDYDRMANIAGGAPVYAIAFDRYSYDPTLGYAATLYAGTYGDGVWKSTDGGKTWVKASSMLRPATTFDLRVTRLAVDTYATGKGYVFAGTDGGGFYIADAYAMLWVRALGTRANPFQETVVQGISVQDPYIWVAGRNGIHYTTAYARNIAYTGVAMDWYTATGINLAPQTTNTDVRGFAVSPNGMMYAITYGDVLGTGTTARGGVYRSSDHGVSWSKLTDVYSATGAHRLDAIDVYASLVTGGVSSLYDTVVVGAEGRAVYKASFDAYGTATWQRANGTAPNNITNNLFTTQQVLHSGPTQVQVQALTATYQPMNDYAQPGPGYLGANPGSIYNGESVTYRIRVSDDLGNRLKQGSNIAISATSGLLTGNTGATLADGTYDGTDYIVTWTNNIATATNPAVDTVASLNVAVTSPNGTASVAVPAVLVNPLAGVSTSVVVSPYTAAGSGSISVYGGSNGNGLAVVDPYAGILMARYEVTSLNGCVGTVTGTIKTAVRVCKYAPTSNFYNKVYVPANNNVATFVYNLPGTTGTFTYTDSVTIRDLETGQTAQGTITISAK